MRKIILFILISFLLSSCYTEFNKETPQDDYKPSISQDELILIITDLQLVQAALRYKENAGQDIKNMNTEYHQMIFDKYGVSKEELEENLEYYKLNIKEFNKIYEKVIENLSKLESEIKSEQ